MTMLEKMAMAICDCEAAGPISWSAAKVVARTALEAVREPSSRMEVEGAITRDFDAVNMPSRQRAVAVWQAMIDAILAETETGETDG